MGFFCGNNGSKFTGPTYYKWSVCGKKNKYTLFLKFADLTATTSRKGKISTRHVISSVDRFSVSLQEKKQRCVSVKAL